MSGGEPATLVADRFQLSERIGIGGMATVWLARDLRLGRTVAIKRLHHHLAGTAGAGERFTREALAAAALSHPSIVTVFDAGEDDEGAYLVMEYVEGRTLSHELSERGRLPAEEAVRIALACAEGLAHAHQRGVIHRDMKPGNVLLRRDGSVKLTDFGIAKVAWDERQLTETASLIGTAAYLSPEQAAGGEVTPQSDLYSLGVILYQMLTGRAPFQTDNPLATALAHTNRQPQPPGQVLPLPAPLEAVVMRCLEKEPARRFPDAASLAAALRDLESDHLPATLDDGHPTLPLTRPEEPPTLDLPPEPSTVVDTGPTTARRRRTSGWWWGLAVVVLAAALVAWLLLDPRGPAAPDTTATTTTSSTTTTTSPTTTAAVEQAPTNFDEALVLLTNELSDLRNGQEIFPPLKRDLENRLSEITREWEKEGKPGKTRERLEAFVDKVQKGEEEGEINSEPADRLVEAGAVAISFLPTDEGDDDD